jgi:hypothetical protein
MFQPEPAAYIQVSTGYAIPHSVSDYTFEETPLRLNDGRGSGALGTGPSGANALLYAPMLSAPAGNRVQVGPAPSSPGSFNFNPTSLPAAPSTVPAPSHQPAPLPILLKMESSADELVAQEAAAREYQPQLEVNPPDLLSFGDSLSISKPRAHQTLVMLSAGTACRQENAEHSNHRRICQGGPDLCPEDNGG